jgi:proliferating cell nuclear antigen PCNA
MEESKYLVRVDTLQPSNFKALFGILKDNYIQDININFSPTGIEILEMDPTHVVVAHVLLSADKFETFYCKQPIKIGVDSLNLTKSLKGIGTKDILTIFVKDPKENMDGGDSCVSFGLIIDTMYLDTMDVNDYQMSAPNIDYPCLIQLPSSDLQSIIGNLKNVGGDVIKVLFHKNTLQFYTKGEVGACDITRSRTSKEDTSIKIQKNDLDVGIIEIYVKLDKMVEFTKCSCLSPIVTIYLQNDFPLFLEYDVGSVGIIRLGVSPHTKPDNY